MLIKIGLKIKLQSYLEVALSEMFNQTEKSKV